MTGDPNKARLMRLWEQAIKGPIPLAGADFFELGGASLAAMRLCAGVEREFGIGMTVRDVFERPKLEDQLAFIAAAPRRPVGPAARRRSARIPLTMPQQSFWRVQQAIPEASFFNHVLRLDIDGPVDRGCLVAALQDVQNRHGALRITISGSGDEAFQTVHRKAKLDLTQAACGPGEIDGAVERAERAERRAPFDLTGHAPFRARLISSGADRTVLLLTMHHIAFDGWSRRLLMEDLIAYYTARLDGQEPDYPQANDYVSLLTADDDRKSNGDWSRAVNTWIKALSGTLADLSPAGALHADAFDYRTATRKFRIEPEVADMAGALARSRGVTAFTVLLASFMITMSAMSGAREGRAAVQVANRGGADRERVIGALANTVLIRIPMDTERGPEFGDVVDRVHAAATEIYEFQHVPFEYVMDELGKGFELASVLQICFALHDEVGDYSLPGCRMSAASVSGDEQAVDPNPAELVLEMRPVGGGYDGWLTYQTAIYPAPLVDDAVERFVATLAQHLTPPMDQSPRHEEMSGE